MTPFQSLCEYLKAQSGIARVYPIRLPKEPVFPCICFEIVTSTGYMTLGGSTGLSEVRIQATVWDNELNEDLTATVRQALLTMSGRIGNPTTGWKIQGVVGDIPTRWTQDPGLFIFGGVVEVMAHAEDYLPA